MINGLKILRHYLSQKYLIQFKNREALLLWQQQRLASALQQASRNFSYFSSFAGAAYESFPITNKKIMMNNFERFNAYNISMESALETAILAENTRNFTPMIGKVSVGLSTGTTGNKGIFLVNQNERLRWAGTILAKCLPSSIFKKQRIAFVFRADNNLYSTMKSKRLQFQFFDIKQPFQNLLQQISDYSPHILIAPAQVLSLLAKHIMSRELHLKPSHIISVAEVLDDLDRKLIQTAFRVNVHQIYQATEGLLGTTCAYGTMHLNEDLLFFEREYLDNENRRFIPIITDFYRETQAIIRYRLDDILIASKERCQCGSVLQALDKIEGRSDDIIYLTSQNNREMLTPVFPDNIRNTIVTACSNVNNFDFQVIQTADHSLNIELTESVQKDVEVLIFRALSHLFKSMEVNIPLINFKYGIYRDLTRKFRRIESKINISELRK